MDKTYNTRVLMSGYPTYIGMMPFTQMQRNNVGQKKASTSWRFDDATMMAGEMIEIIDQEVEIHPEGEFAVIDAYRRPHIVRVCMVDTVLDEQGKSQMGKAKQLTREELVARIPQEEVELRKNYDDYTDPCRQEGRSLSPHPPSLIREAHGSSNDPNSIFDSILIDPFSQR